MLGKAVSKNSLILGAFAVITTAIIAATYLATKDQIAEQERIARAKALLEIVPLERHDNQMLDDTVEVADLDLLGFAAPATAFVARKNNEIVAFILPVTAPDGYSGDIKMIVGINADGSVAGVRVLAHAETPGLGDKVELQKSDWILGFSGKSLTNPLPASWSVKRDKGEFDQFTGATITPRAVTKAVARALQYFAGQRDELMQKANIETQSPTAIGHPNG